MAATATDLTIDATVSAELGISAAGTVVPRLILVASEAVRSYLRRGALHYSSTVTETLAGYGRVYLSLQRMPIVAITSIAVDGTTVTSTEYSIYDANAGLVYREDGWLWSANYQPGIVYERNPGTEKKNITVVYGGGWVTPGQNSLDNTQVRTLPYDIEQATIDTCVALYRNRGRDWNVSSETLGGASITYSGANTAIGRGEGGIIPDAAVALLRPYRVPV